MLFNVNKKKVLVSSNHNKSFSALEMLVTLWYENSYFWAENITLEAFFNSLIMHINYLVQESQSEINIKARLIAALLNFQSDSSETH